MPGRASVSLSLRQGEIISKLNFMVHYLPPDTALMES